MAGPKERDDRVFNRSLGRHFRRTYSVREAKSGLLIGAGIVALATWVAWKGQRPDPGLLLTTTPALPRRGMSPVDRGPIPDLTTVGWRETNFSVFDAERMYEKINGRADYYRSFGCDQLQTLTLGADAGPSIAIDLEIYRFPGAEDALGAYAGERAPEARAELHPSGLRHRTRNALFATVGRFYVRALGSEASPSVDEMLTHVREIFASKWPAEALPWGYALFSGKLGIDPGRIEYARENAFSFDFGRGVYMATLEDDEAQLYVTPAASAERAAELAAQFRQGFLEYGEIRSKTAGLQWIEDRYLGTLSTAMAHDAWVVGVRGTKTQDAAKDRLDTLIAALGDFQVSEISEASESPSGSRNSEDAEDYERPEKPEKSEKAQGSQGSDPREGDPRDDEASPRPREGDHRD